MVKPLLLTSLILLIAGCGFQLRGTDISGLDAISLSGPAAQGIRAELETALESSGVVRVPAAPGVLDVRLLDVRSSRRPVATSARMDAAQYELRIEVDMSLVLDGQPVAADVSLAAQRLYSVDSLNLSGSYEEQQILMSEIRAELAGLIIYRVEAWLENADRNTGN